ncbi:hypothetical protein [Helicobacter suis]|uniref:hypothetical protein n=1 Tax=Helicobacter suis TaxID=104628 RepID=UPI0013D25FE6|nr:hypothetical protein [Helicobacter suis]
MACKFCPKIRSTDLLFVLIAGGAFYGVYTHQIAALEATKKHTENPRKIQKADSHQDKSMPESLNLDAP